MPKKTKIEVEGRCPHLTWRQKISVAYAHHVLGVNQQDIVPHYPGCNIGRIATACKDIKLAAQGADGADEDHFVQQHRADLEKLKDDLRPRSWWHDFDPTRGVDQWELSSLVDAAKGDRK